MCPGHLSSPQCSLASRKKNKCGILSAFAFSPTIFCPALLRFRSGKGNLKMDSKNNPVRYLAGQMANRQTGVASFHPDRSENDTGGGKVHRFP